MALINFDCPECGHNLEVDERGSGFIVKCPECGNPLQVPELPRGHRIRKTVAAVSLLLAILLLLLANIRLWQQAAKARGERDAQTVALNELRDKAQLLSMQQEEKIQHLEQDVRDARAEATDDLTDAALDALEEAERLAEELNAAEMRLVESSNADRMKLLREHMRGTVNSAKKSLPTAPEITDAGAGRGIQGQKIIFPVLPGPDGQTLRENAAVMGIEDDKVSVSFPGGSATYSLTELHPGVAAYLPVDPLLVLPRAQWKPEVIRIQQTRNAQRDEELSRLRSSVEKHLPED